MSNVDGVTKRRELLFVWIENYKIIVNQGFNFSADWHFEYDLDSKKLQVRDRVHPLPKNFFGDNISNVTAILGENGVGKTTILSFLRKSLFSRERERERAICVYLEEATIYVSYPDGIQVELDFDNSILPTPVLQESLPLFAGIYYSNIFDGSTYPYLNMFGEDDLAYSDLCDISTAYLLRRDKKTGFQHLTESQAYRIMEVKRNLAFLNSSGDVLDLEEFSFLPNKVLIELSFRKRDSNVERKSLFNEDVRDRLLVLYGKVETDRYSEGDNSLVKARNAKSFVLEGIVKNLVANLLKYPNLSFINIQTKEELNKQTDIDAFDNFINANPDISYIKKIKDEIFNLIDTGADKTRYMNTRGDSNVLPLDHESFTLNLSVREGQDFFTLFETSLNQLHIFVNKKNTHPQHTWRELLTFEWRDISTGEKALLNLFARLYFAKQKIGEDAFILLMIDEGELGFHPQWQKKYLSLLLEYINETFNNDVQIILTSHSPFILSDLPKENVIFLRKKNSEEIELDDDPNMGTTYIEKEGVQQKQTFLADIHDLLIDGFFLSNGLKGVFATEKLKKTISWLKDSNTSSQAEYDYHERIINFVDDQLLTIKLNELLGNKDVTDS